MSDFSFVVRASVWVERREVEVHWAGGVVVERRWGCSSEFAARCLHEDVTRLDRPVCVCRSL